MQHINTFNKGMTRGIDYTIIPQSSYLYMLNGCLISRDDKGFVVTSIKGTTKIAEFDTNEVPIGSIVFNGIVYIITHRIVDSEAFINVWSYKGSDGTTWVSDIRIIPNGPESLLSIPSGLLGFSRDKLLEVIAKESHDGSVDLYLCDGLSPNAVINTGLDRNGKSTDRQYTEFTSKVQFAFQKSITKAPEVSTSIGSVGNIKPGTYFFYVRYEDETLNATPFIKEVGPITIHAGSTESNNAVGVANTGDVRISKNITLNVTDADPLYKRVSVAVVYYFGVDGILSRENFLINKSYVLVDDAANIVFDGDNDIRSILVEEIIADNIQYNVSESQIQLNNRYYGANWKGGEIDYNYLKEMARRIMPRAVIHPDNNFDKVHEQNTSENEYMENEIYPFGVSFLIDGRYKTPVFPVCGWQEGNVKTNVIKVPDIPSMSIEDVEEIDIYASSFSVVFEIGYSADIEVLDRGMMWKENTNPTADDNDDMDSFGPGHGIDLGHATELSPSSTYKYRVYIKLAGNHYIYSEVKSVTTKSGVPSISTYDGATNILATSATCYGNISNDNGSAVNQKGIWYSTSNSDPHTTGTKKSDGSGIGMIEASITGLQHNTTYYYRAYAINEFGVYYGAPYSFKTASGALSISTVTVFDVSPISASSGGSIYDDGGGAVATQKGICWALSSELADPDYLSTNNNTTNNGSGNDPYTALIGGLIKDNTYYLRAYAISNFGITSYGTVIEFQTEPGWIDVYLKVSSDGVDTVIVESFDSDDNPISVNTDITVSVDWEGQSAVNIVIPSGRSIGWFNAGYPPVNPDIISITPQTYNNYRYFDFDE